MSDTPIPPQVVEAALPHAAMCQSYCKPSATDCQCRQDMYRALRAGLAAWPGMAVNDGCPVWHAYPHLTLPLPQDKQS